MEPTNPVIPPFRADGYLPEGLYPATEAEIVFRFGVLTRRRRRLVIRLRRWIELVRQTGGQRLLIDGSFVTAKAEPDDIDAVVLLARDFQRQIDRGFEPAFELEEMLITRRPEEIFAAEDEQDWIEWAEFFGRTREAGNVRKGLVEVQL
jgi:hypothetical protein